MRQKYVLFLSLLLAASALAYADTPASQPALTPDERWQAILPYFSPPQKYADKNPALRTVMKFDNGSPVATPADWPKRRQEIRAYWDAKLGAWPALLEKPTVQFTSEQHVDNFTRHKIKIQLAEKMTRDAYLLVPDGEGPFPAVVCVFYDAETSAGLDPNKATRAFGSDLAKRGFVTLCLGNPGNDPRKPADHPCQPLMFLAYVAANAHTALAQMPTVDPHRIGIIGHSFGGKWAMFASCLCDKFAAAVWSDPGIIWNEKDANANYWEPWYLGTDTTLPTQRKPGIPSETDPRTGPYKQLLAENHDLHELHALMAPRPFLVSGGAQDPPSHWTTLNTDITLYKFLGYENRIALTARSGHAPTKESDEIAYRFLEHFLKDAPPK